MIASHTVATGRALGRAMRSMLVSAVVLAFASTSCLRGDAATMTLVDPAVVAPIDTLVAGIDAGAAGAVVRAYAASPTITDEFAPFVWRGAGAAKRWSVDFARMTHAGHIDAIRVTHGRPSYVATTPERAWVVVPATFRYRAGGAMQRETAAWTFALVRTAIGWRIATSTWAKTSDTAAS